MQEFGAIVFLLAGSKACDRKKGASDFYEFKRHFMIWEFDEVIDELNDYRAMHGFKTIQELLEEIGDQLVHKEVLPAEESIVDISGIINAPRFSDDIEKDQKYFNPENAKQLSLF